MTKLPAFLLRVSIIPLMILLVPIDRAAAEGTTFAWLGMNGEFGSAGEWDPSDGPPGPKDEVVLSGAGVTISFAADAEVDRISIPSSSSSQMTFDLNGNTFTASGSSEKIALKIESNEPHSNNILTISNGTFALNNRFILQQGMFQAANTQVLVFGPGAVFNTTAGRSIIGFFGYSEVILENGGVWENQQLLPLAEGRPDLDIGLNAAREGRAGKGLLRVTGPGSAYVGSTDPATPFAAQPRIRVGVEENAEGTIEILAGGTFEADVVYYGTNATSVGAALVSGAGSSYTAKATYLGGFVRSDGVDFDPRGSAIMTVEDGATATTGLLHVASFDSSKSGKLVLDNGTMTVTGYSGVRATLGARFHPGAHLAVTLHDKGNPAALVASDRLTITMAKLSIQLAPSFRASGNDRFILSTYGELTGTFDGLPNESTLAVGDYKFRIDYGSGVNDAITLTVVP